MKISLFLLICVLPFATGIHAQSGQKTAELQRLIASANVPGIQLVYVKGTRAEVYNLGYARADSSLAVTPRTIFEAASLSKAVFAYLVFRVIDRGLLNLDTPLLKYIGHYDRFDAANPAYGRVTARMVLRHTTGFPNWGDSARVRLLFPPDSCYSYSGEGYVYLQKVVEKLTGKTLNQLANEELFVPLHMTSSSYDWIPAFDSVSAFGHDADAVQRHKDQNAAYSLLTNAHDYTVFLQAVIAGTGLSASSHKQMLTESTRGNWFNHRVLPATPHIGWALGLGVQHNEKGISFWQWGDNGDFKGFYIIHPETKESLVYFTHSNKGLFITEELVDLFMGKQTTWAARWTEEGYQDPYAVKAFRELLDQHGYDQAAAIWDQQKKQHAAFNLEENDLNEFGYMLLQSGRKQQAIEIFKLNVSLHPQSANPYDSLAEAYEAVGNKELALVNYKKCVELDPKNEYAAKQVTKLMGK